VRLFTAIEISAGVRTRLEEVLRQLRPTAHLRWTPVENLHITTKFIGEWTEDRLGELQSNLTRVPKTGAFEVAIRGLGWFPNPHNPRVFWAGVHAPESLRQLAADTERAVAPLGVAEEKREFKPHLTLARTRDTLSKEALGAVRRAVANVASDDFGTFEATSQYLYLSAGGKYTKLAAFSLSES